MMFNGTKQNYIQLDSKQEEEFAENLDYARSITVYAKLSVQFKIPTPKVVF